MVMRPVVALMRHPVARLYSAFKYKQPISIFGGPPKLPSTIEEYLQIPGITGCQTKMIVGLPCNSFTNLTSLDFETAKVNPPLSFYTLC